MRWLVFLIMFPALTFAAENCKEQFNGVCKEACAQGETAEQGAFLDCTEKQVCCVKKDVLKNDPVSSVRVIIDSYVFSPDVIKIKAGTEVVWKNNEATVHTVTAEDGSFSSGSIEQGGEFRKTFLIPGTYSYSCEMHSFMSGKIVVE